MSDTKYIDNFSLVANKGLLRNRGDHSYYRFSKAKDGAVHEFEYVDVYGKIDLMYDMQNILFKYCSNKAVNVDIAKELPDEVIDDIDRLLDMMSCLIDVTSLCSSNTRYLGIRVGQ